MAQRLNMFKGLDALKDVCYYLEHKKYKNSTFSKSTIRHKALKYKKVNGKFVYAGKEELKEVPTTAAECLNVLKQFHDDPTTGRHQGENLTMKKVQQHYHWPGMSYDIKQYVKNCSHCQQHKEHRLPKQLDYFKVTEVWHTLGVDIIGPLAETESANKYICAIVDLFSKFVFAKAVTEKSPHACAAVIKDVVYLYGPPENLITDLNDEFCAQVNNLLVSNHGINHCVVYSYHPQTSHAKRHIKKNPLMEQENWDNKLDRVIYNLNTFVKPALKTSSYEVFFGRKPRDFPIPQQETVIVEEIPSIITDSDFEYEIISFSMPPTTETKNFTNATSLKQAVNSRRAIITPRQNTVTAATVVPSQTVALQPQTYRLLLPQADTDQNKTECKVLTISSCGTYATSTTR